MTTETERELAKLLPCPFCGGEADDSDYRGLKFYVVCGECYVRTNDYRCHADAIAAWNARHNADPSRDSLRLGIIAGRLHPRMSDDAKMLREIAGRMGAATRCADLTEEERIAIRDLSMQGDQAYAVTYLLRVIDRLTALKPEPQGGETGDAERLTRIATIIESVDHRAGAADGPVTPTLQEMTQEEISSIYALSKGQDEGWRP